MQSKVPILIIEDSAEDYEAAVRAFTKAGVTNPIYRFSYGEDAFDFLKQRGPFFKHGEESRPGLILLDLNLPGTDGHKVLAEIRREPTLRAIPVVVFSTSSNPSEIERCYTAGANAYIIKPPGPAELYQVINRIKEFWLETAALPARPEAIVHVPAPRSAERPGR